MSTPLKALTSGIFVTLKQKLASSGEGTVWTTSQSGLLAKLYHQPTRDRIDKLKVMIAHPPQNPMRHHHHVTFAWPQDILTDAQGNGLGFLMPEIVDGVKMSVIYNPKLRSRKAPRFNWYYLHTAALNFALALKSLHEEGYIVGDIKPQNLLVNNRALISVIDTDSFQVRDPVTQTLYRCLVGSEGFTPVELLGKELSKVDQQEVHDRFRLGVMVYLLLFGDQPFKGKWVGRGESPQPSELIRQGFWPYAPDSQVQPGPNTIPLSILHPQLQVCFQRCFTAGHRNPQERPSAEEWGDALKHATADLRMCHLETNHHYSQTYGRCYWCDRRLSVGMDIFSPDLASTQASLRQKTAAAKMRAGAARTVARSAPVRMATSTLNSLQQMQPFQTGTTVWRPNSLTAGQNRTAILSRWPHPISWGAACIVFGLLGLTLLLLPEVNAGMFSKGFTALESTLQRRIWPAKKVTSLVNAKSRSIAQILSAKHNLLHGGHWETITALDISPDDRLLISGSKDMTVKLWSFPDGKIQSTLLDHYEPIISASFGDNGKTLLTSSLSGKVLAWDVNGSTLTRLPSENNFDPEGTIRSAVASAKSTLVASSGWEGTITLQDLQSGKVTKVPSNSMASEQSLAILPDGKSLITSSNDGRFQVWDTSTGILLKTFPSHSAGDTYEPINVLAMSRDGKLLVSGGWYGSVTLWNVEKGTMVKQLPKQNQPVSVIAINDRKDQVATVSNSAAIKLWDVGAGKQTATLQDHKAEFITALKFSHSGNRLVSGSDQPAITIWNLKAQQSPTVLVQ